MYIWASTLPVAGPSFFYTVNPLSKSVFLFIFLEILERLKIETIFREEDTVLPNLSWANSLLQKLVQ